MLSNLYETRLLFAIPVTTDLLPTFWINHNQCSLYQMFHAEILFQTGTTKVVDIEMCSCLFSRTDPIFIGQLVLHIIQVSN